jgi:hypothetical protein
VLDPTVIVMVELPDPGAAMVVGLNETVVPEGTPEADNAMELLNPLLTTVVMVEWLWLPWGMLKDAGEAEILKVPPFVTVRLAVPWIDPEVALMVVLPAATPVANPPVLIVATEGELEVQVAEFVRSWWLPSL